MEDLLVKLEHGRSRVPDLGSGHWLLQWLAGLSVGDGVYALVLAAGATIRLVDLGRLPLSPGEASSAWSVWQQWQAGGDPFTVASPAYFSMTALLTQVVGFSDGVMRLVPVLFGLGTLLLPWMLRQRLGSVGTTLFVLLLALSPIHVSMSRTAGGDSIALFAALLVAVSLFRWLEARQLLWFNTMWAAIGLGLASTPLFYGALAVLGLAWLAMTYLGPTLAGDGIPTPLNRAAWRGAALSAGIVFTATATMFLWYPAGAAAAAAIPAEWVGLFTLGGDFRSLMNPLLAIARYETLLAVMGVFAVASYVRRANPLGAFGAYWLLATVLLVFLQAGQLESAVLLSLPGYLLVALLARRILSPGIERAVYGLAGAVAFGGGIILVNLGQYSRAFLYNPQLLASLWTAFLVFAVLTFAIYFVASWRRSIAVQSLFLGLAILALFYQWGTAWWLGHEASNDPRERWVQTGTDDDVLVLAELIRGISRQMTGTDGGIDIFSTVDTPVLRWYLREFPALRFGATLPAGSRSSLVISHRDIEPTLTGEYAGGDFGLLRNGVQRLPSANPNAILDTLRWWLFHDTRSIPTGEKLTLWWRGDLVQAPG